MKQTFDCVIIGAGIAGMTAAIYLKRANKKVVLVEKEILGGLINKTSAVENYPGFIKIDGPSLVMNVYNQIQELNIPIIYDEVIDVLNNQEKIVYLKNNDSLDTKAIIISTGRIPRTLGIPKEKELLGHGISYCALCDGTFFKNKDVCVIGGGNSALEESYYLSNICHKVTIVNRSNQLRADTALVDQINTKDNVQILLNSKVEEIHGKDKLESVTINGNNISCEGLFIYIGLDPNIDYLKNLNLENDKGYIVVDKDMKTSLEGIYACGDSIKKSVYQIITAASEGAIAATSVEKYLRD